MPVQVRNNEADVRYEAVLDGHVAGFAEYHRREDRVVFTHTEVAPQAEGRGVATALIEAALDDVRRQGKLAVPLCPFVTAYIRKHTEYADLVPAEYRAAVSRG